MIRVVSWPYYRNANPYLDLFYDALRAHGVEHVGRFTADDGYLRQNHKDFEVIHIQWLPEALWRTRGKGVLSQVRGILGMIRFFRLAKRLGKTVVWTMHDVEHLEGSSRVDRLGYRAIARNADLCICHSRWGGEQALRRYGARQVMHLHFGNFDGVYPAPRPRGGVLADLGLSPDRRTLLCFGAIRPYKGFELALDAMSSLGPGYQLIIAGTTIVPEYEALLHRRTAEVPRVKFIAREIDNQELADLAGAADCAALPYLRITGSLAVMTPLTFGRGVVASDLPFFRELLAMGPEAGVLFPVGDAAALARAVHEFFAPGVEHRAAAARQLADQFAWRSVVQPYADWLHQRVCGARGAGNELTAARR